MTVDLLRYEISPFEMYDTVRILLYWDKHEKYCVSVAFKYRGEYESPVHNSTYNPTVSKALAYYKKWVKKYSQQVNKEGEEWMNDRYLTRNAKGKIVERIDDKTVADTDKSGEQLNEFEQGGQLTESQRIASTILQQLGGMNRLRIMTGAYNFLALDKGVSFRIKNPKANYIKITLTSADLYDLEIGRVRGGTYKVVYSIEGIYYDQLKGLIEEHTGMYLSLEKGGEVAESSKQAEQGVLVEENIVTNDTLPLSYDEFVSLKPDLDRYYAGDSEGTVYKPYFDTYTSKTYYTKDGKKSLKHIGMHAAYQFYLWQKYGLNVSDEQILAEVKRSKHRFYEGGGEMEVVEENTPLNKKFWKQLSELWMTNRVSFAHGKWSKTHNFKNILPSIGILDTEADSVIALANEHNVKVDDIKTNNPGFTAFDFYKEKLGYNKMSSIPTYVGDGFNISVFGYDTVNFDMSKQAAILFEELKIKSGVDEFYVINAAKEFDAFFGIERDAIIAGKATQSQFLAAMNSSLMGATLLEKAGGYEYLDTFKFIHFHMMEIAKRLPKEYRSGGSVTKGNLIQIGNDVQSLDSLIKGDAEVEEWVKDEISKASDRIHRVRNYLNIEFNTDSGVSSDDAKQSYAVKYIDISGHQSQENIENNNDVIQQAVVIAVTPVEAGEIVKEDLGADNIIITEALPESNENYSADQEEEQYKNIESGNEQMYRGGIIEKETAYLPNIISDRVAYDLVDEKYPSYPDVKAAEYADKMSKYLYKTAEEKYKDSQSTFKHSIGKGSEIGKERFFSIMKAWGIAWMVKHPLTESVDVMASGGRVDMDNEKFERVLHEFKVGELKDRWGNKVISRSQALAIAFSEAKAAKHENKMEDGGEVTSADGSTHKYKLGDKYRSDFDYDGLVAMGLKANEKWSVDRLEKLERSFEDVNYHDEAGLVHRIIAAINRKQLQAAKMHVKYLHDRLKEADIYDAEEPVTYEVVLKAVPNPDYDKNSHNGTVNIPAHTVTAKSLDDARMKVALFIADNDLGGGNFVPAKIMLNGVAEIGTISYNGRIWNLDGTPMVYENGGSIEQSIEQLYAKTPGELAADYMDKYGLPASHQPVNKIVAALYFNKRIKNLTDTDINYVDTAIANIENKKVKPKVQRKKPSTIKKVVPVIAKKKFHKKFYHKM